MNPKLPKEVTDNICRGCKDQNKDGESPDKVHFCRHVQRDVDPVIATYERGNRNRNKLCPHRKIQTLAPMVPPLEVGTWLRRTG